MSETPPLGKLTPEAFARLVAPHLGAARPEVAVGPRAGHDAAIVKIGAGGVAAVGAGRGGAGRGGGRGGGVAVASRPRRPGRGRGPGGRAGAAGRGAWRRGARSRRRCAWSPAAGPRSAPACASAVSPR